MNPSATQGAALDRNGVLVDPSRTFTDTITVASGENLAAGAVLGKVTASGKYVLSDDGSADGSETPVAILAEAVDASAGDKSGLIYLAGDFDERKLTFGGTHSAVSLRHALAAVGIFLHRSVSA